MKKLSMILLTASIAFMALLGCAVPAKEPASTPEPAANMDQPASTPTSLTQSAAEGAAVPVPQETENEDIEIYIKQKTVTTETESVTLIIINGGEETYSYDYVQKLERKNAEGAWETVPLTNDAVSLALLTIAGGETQEQVFDFANHYEPLERGSYRIVKTFVNITGGVSNAYCEFDAM